MKRKDVNKFRGCLVGGAVGDALGYPVEFKSIDEIKAAHGDAGITKYQCEGGEALVSYNTQMAMFAAEGIMFGATHEFMRKKEEDRGSTLEYIEDYVFDSLLNWGKIQGYAGSGVEINHESWIIEENENLKENRAADEHIIELMKEGKGGTITEPVNQYKDGSCLTRVAPVAVFYDRDTEGADGIAMAGARVAALTNGHPFGYVSAAILADLINRLIYCEYEAGSDALFGMVSEACDTAQRLFPDNAETKEVVNLISEAAALARESDDDVAAVQKIGQGWDANEALAIAVYCALKYKDSFEKGVLTAVNHSGNSETTGSLTGNILGAYLGLPKIPYTLNGINLELKFVIQELADDLYTGVISPF